MTNLHTDPTKRHEFVLLFDVENGNPNGDPDAGNLPRIDPETMHGIVTDVALKRKVRDYLIMTKGIPMFIQSETALNRLIFNAAKEEGFEPLSVELSEDDEELIEWFKENNPDNFELDGLVLTCLVESQKEKDIKKAFNDVEDASLKRKLNALVKRMVEGVSAKKLSEEIRIKTRQKMIDTYYDIKMFGAVLAVGLNAGQVRGPMQFTFAKSVDQIARLDVSITRVAITKEEDKKRKSTEMGRKSIVPYGLYRTHGFYNPYLAKKDPKSLEYNVTSNDLENLWEALANMFEYDHSAARGQMATRGLYVFTHENDKGNAPSHKLFKRIAVPQKECARKFEDYMPITVDETDLDKIGVHLTKIVHEV
jgi:CRISPR-associated protein Csd2